MSVNIQTLVLILSYIVIVFSSTTVKPQLVVSNSTSGNETQCGILIQSNGRGVPECYCDSKCTEYGDCCPNSPFKRDPNKPFQNCTSFVNGDFYVKRFFSNGTVTRKCIANYTFVNLRTMKNKVPVTSLKTNFSFVNKNCADGYNISDFQLWTVNVTCNDFNDYLTVSDNGSRASLTIHSKLNDKFKYVKSLKVWQITLTNGTRNCTLRPQVPDNLKSVVRPCISNVINKCSSIPSAQSYCDQCQSIYTDANSSKIYRNRNCAWCSGAITNYSIPNVCNPLGIDSLINPAAVTAPLVFPTWSTSSPRTTPPTPTTATRPSTTSSPGSQTKVVDRSYIQVSIEGEKYTETLKRINMTKILTQTVEYSKMSRTFLRNFTEIEGSKIQTCNISEKEQVYDNSQIPKLVPTASNIVLILASAFLGLSLRHFLMSQSPNEYQYRFIMSSYTIAVLLSNGGWFFKNILNNSVDDLFNPFDQVVNYFAFMTSLMCATSMAFHVSHTSWKAFYQFSAIQNDSQSKNSYLYSTVNWFVPAIVTLLENSMGSTFSTLNEKHTLYLLIFLVLPFIAIFSANTSFYVNSAVLLAAEKAVEEKLQKLEINFTIFSALLGITHLMWLVALLFCYLRSYFLMVLFYILNLVVCLLVYCIASGKKIFAAESVQFSGDKSSSVIVNKEE